MGRSIAVVRNGLPSYPIRPALATAASVHHLWTPPALQELSLTAWHYGSVAAIYPACRCSPQAAGLDEIRGSAPNQSIEHERSLVHTGLADPGLTCPAITSSIALANRWGEP